MHGKIAFAGLVLALSATCTSAQNKGQTTTQDDIYCSGVVTTESVPRDTYVITGEGSNVKNTFQEGDYVTFNKGANQGVKVGDQFFVVRAITDPTDVEWTKWQASIMKKLGKLWADQGRLKVVVVQPDVSIAQVQNSCNYVQRGDIVLPFTERPAPPLKSEINFDRFAPPSGKPTAMIINGRYWAQQSGTNSTVYVNLGTNQGVRIGDYFRIFRYQGTEHETAYQIKRIAFEIEPEFGEAGFGSVPRKWNWNNVPREVLGEGVVVRTAPNSASVLITFSLREILAGDYVELE
ncbi:MAG TPA: FlgT C-terminal domain-containing protein [Candidatus Limnocylindria bacterium]|nr:FlgT C-terminal domain-containing protein [Candidatus Limnocylindria bacterium]